MFSSRQEAHLFSQAEKRGITNVASHGAYNSRSVRQTSHTFSVGGSLEWEIMKIKVDGSYRIPDFRPVTV